MAATTFKTLAAAALLALVGVACASEAEPIAQGVLDADEELTMEERGYTTCADNPDCADAAQNPTTTTMAGFDDPQPDDFTINVIVLSENCFGTAGCNVTYDIEVGWSVYLDPSATYQLTYEVTGSDYGTSTETVEITGDEYTPPFEGFTSTSGAGTVLTATPVRVR